MRVEKIGVLASANGAKPAIIIDKLFQYHMLGNYEVCCFTTGREGKCYDVCQKYGIPVIIISDPHFRNQEDIACMKDAQCDLLISMGWPFYVPQEVLNVFPRAINCHGSVLPDYRGSSSYMHYYANLEPYYGVSIHYMNEKFDDGKVLIQSAYETRPGETNDDMHIRSAELCAFLLPQAISLVEKDYEGFEPSGEKRYFYKCTPEEFIEYRKRNEKLKAEGQPLILTPHKRM